MKDFLKKHWYWMVGFIVGLLIVPIIFKVCGSKTITINEEVVIDNVELFEITEDSITTPVDTLDLLNPVE